MSMVQQAIEVGAPLHTVYEQIAAFENYPRFMTGVERVTPIGDDQTHWVLDVDGRRREFDARVTERSPDQRVSWSAVDGPLLAETITLRPMGETRTQVVAQLEADIAFLMPSDRHGQETLNRRLKDDLATFKGLVESGRMPAATALGGAGSEQLTGRSGTIFGSGAHADPASPASVAARIRKRTPAPHPGPGRGASGEIIAAAGTEVDIAGAPGIDSAADLDDVLAPGRRIVGGPGAVRGGAAGTAAGSAPMGGRTPAKDVWGDGMINEEDRGSAHDY
jgi:ribosome-associated toxin RatA of RatAB toxin-antitoxin module